MHPTVMMDPLHEVPVTREPESIAETSVSSVKFRQIAIPKKLLF